MAINKMRKTSTTYLMKKIFIFCIVTVFANTVFAQTLFTYGTTQTSKDEFLRAYNKNKPTTADKAKAMREYLELYSNFKLKVKAAQDLRLDTLQQIKYDVQNFRDQVIENYLNDDKGLQVLIDEAVERSSKDVHVLYFSVPVASEAAPADTRKAYNAAKALVAALRNTSTNNYSAIASEITTKFAPAKFADAGFVTAFSVPYDFENIIYSTAIGAVSEPYRTSKGWSMFKIAEQRPAIGKWKVAQLLFAFPPNADANTKLAIKRKADSVVTLLQNGMAFGDAAKQFSDDRMTYLSGGELPEFSSGKYTALFESNVIALKKDNDITKPFETDFGYHIVKRISHAELPANKKEAAYQFEIKQKVQQDVRINAVKDKFIKDITANTGFKTIAAVKEAELFKNADSVISSSTAENNIDKLSSAKKAIISFKDGTKIKGEEWLAYVRNNKPNVEMPRISNKVMFQNFTKQVVLNYYKKNLELYNTDFKYQMQEFKEGNMLFEIMERNVWSKAGTDSISLMKYYETHKSNYKWAASADVLIFNCTDEKKANDAFLALKENKTWNRIVENSNNQVQADSGRYELAQIPNITENTNIVVGAYSPITKNTDGTASFVKYLKRYDANAQRNFNEARGLIINDYQNVLEQQWLETLKRKYPVKINELVFKEMVR
jgi:peptidyl-prolyl cis-trans isomerase SurA